MKLSTIILSLVPDSIIAYAIMRLLDEQSWRFFIYIFLALQLFYLIRWVFQSIIGWINFKMHKDELINAIYKTLKENKFPEPEKYGFDEKFPESYYRTILSDTDLRVEIRMMTQATDTEIRTMRSLGLLQPLFKLLKAHSEGIKKYQNHFEILNANNA
jgi:hypothetical protein